MFKNHSAKIDFANTKRSSPTEPLGRWSKGEKQGAKGYDHKPLGRWPRISNSPTNFRKYICLCQTKLSRARERHIGIFFLGLAEAVLYVKLSITESCRCTILHLPYPCQAKINFVYSGKSIRSRTKKTKTSLLAVYHAPEVTPSARAKRRSPRDGCGGTCRQAAPSAPCTSRRAS